MRCISVTEFGGPEVLKLITGAAIPKPQARQVSLREKCPYSEFFWSLFSLIRTEYGEIRRYSVWMRENAYQKNSEYGHFSRSVCY